MSRVYVKFPKVGLGNMLLVWARAVVFAKINNLPLTTSSWWGLQLGAWKRREKKKRLYWGYFKESSAVDRFLVLKDSLLGKTINEPAITLAPDKKKNTLFVFNKVIVENDLFSNIRDYRELVKEQLYKKLHPALIAQLSSYESPVISVHIRRGDFKMGNPITPESFFIDCINNIRKVVKEDWRVTVFTDANEEEIKDLLKLPGVNLSAAKPDILDILLMSKSKVIVLSQSSTFSYWGAFLSDAVVLKPAGDWQHELRNADINKITPEIKWKEGSHECELVLEKAFHSLNVSDNQNN